LQYSSYSQLAQSPYSLIGIGDLNSKGLSHNLGMAGTGIAMTHQYNVNNINPALLSLNQYSTFEAGFTGESRTIKSEDLSSNSGGFSLGYLVFAFPIVSGKWTSSIGLMPYSHVQYNVLDRQPIIGSTESMAFLFRGSGGMNTIHWAHGINLYKGLSIGGKVNYHFGNMLDETLLQIIQETELVSFNSALYERTRFSDFSFDLGASYVQKIKDEMFLTLGVIYERGGGIRSFRHERLERRTLEDETVYQDTILHDAKGDVFIPAKMGVGISMANGIKWKIGADYTTQDWSLYEDFDGKPDNLTRSGRASLGMEIIPDYLSVSSYFKRMIYRAGLYYEKTPYKVKDTQIEEFGINFGISLPVSRASLLNLSLQYGQRGQTKNGLIRESYYKMTFGISFNDRWFIRRQID